MASRPVWSGFIRFSLVSIPVRAYTAAVSGGGGAPSLNQLHAECHSRIKYKKTCPVHGEVPNDEIVSGYEYAKDKYVIFEPGEIAKVRTEGDRSIAIDTFVEPDQIDPIYYDGRTYYLAPQNAAAEMPYAVLCEAMKKMDRYGVATVVLHGKEELLLVRPLEGVLTMTMLHYKSQVRSPEILKEEMPSVKVQTQELKLAQQLIDASTSDEFDFSQYEDKHSEHLKKLIDSKVEGKEIVSTPTAEEETPIINLMEALKKSVQQTKKVGSKPKAEKARKQLASRLAKTS